MSEQNKNEIELVRNFDLNLIDKEFITESFSNLSRFEKS